jgi:hypothetical protein
MTPRTQLGYLAAILTLALGLISFLGPLWISEVVGFRAAQLEPRGLSEIRATYGAMFTVMGAMMLWAVPTRPGNASYLRFASFLWLGAGVGRLLSMIIDGVVTPMNFAGLGVEIVIGVCALLASLENPKVTRVEMSEETPDPMKAYR